MATSLVWHLLGVPLGRTGSVGTPVDHLTLSPGPNGDVLFSGQTAECCIVAGTANAKGQLALLPSATCGHQCSITASSTALFAQDQIGGTSCGQIFTRSSVAWVPVSALGMLCPPPPPSSLSGAWKGWTAGASAGGAAGLWVCLGHGDGWDLGLVQPGGQLVSAPLPGICEAVVSTPSGALVAIRPNRVLSATLEAQGGLVLGAPQVLPGKPWAGTFQGFPGTVAAGPRGGLWFLEPAGTSGAEIYRLSARGTLQSWAAPLPCPDMPYDIAPTASGTWLSTAPLQGSSCQDNLSFLDRASGHWLQAPVLLAARAFGDMAAAPDGTIWIGGAPGVTALRPDGGWVTYTTGWTVPAASSSVLVSADGTVWAATHAVQSGQETWDLAALEPSSQIKR